MIARIIEILSGFIVATYLRAGLFRRRSVDGDRVGLHSTAF